MPMIKRPVKKESIGQRGKTAQDEAKKVLDKMNTKDAHFTYVRLADARAAGGRLKKQLSDYICWWWRIDTGVKYSMPLEVKSTEHDYRIGKDDITQLPMLKKSYQAGAYPFVLVLFKGLNQWRIAPIDFFEFGKPSWDMSELKLFDTPEAALSSTGFFPTL